MSSQALISQLEAELPRLKSEEAWEELEAQYETLCRQDIALEQRLYYAWERAELLVTQLDQAERALEVLTDAALWGGPLAVISSRLEELRTIYETPRVNEVAAQCMQRLLRELPQLGAADRAQLEGWLTALGAPIGLEASPSFEPISAPLDTVGDESLSGLESLDVIADDIDLEAQDTAFSDDDPAAAIWAELCKQGAAETDPMGFLSDLEALSELRPLSLAEQGRVEEPLWRAATERSQWRLWLKLYRRVFYREELLPTLSPEERARRAFTIGVVLQDELDESPSAVESFQEVIALFPHHREVFDRLRALLREQKRWAELAELVKRFAPHAPTGELRFELMLELGDMYRDQMKSVPKAVAAWFEALEVEPESRQVFVRLLEVYQESDKWSAAVKVLKKLARLDPEPEKRAFYAYTTGLIQRDQLGDSYLAVRSFDEALDLHPPFLKAFQAIEDTLVSPDDHARRDRYYRKMLLRAVEHELDGSLIAELGRQLGKINLYELDKVEEATQAYEVVLNYEPADDEAHRGLILIKCQTGAVLDAAKLAFQWVRRAPTHVEAYRELYRCVSLAQRPDWAWCVANVLNALGDDDAERQAFLAEASARVGSRLTRPLSEQEWRLLNWSGLDEVWGALISASIGSLSGALQVKPKLYQSHARKGLVDCSEASTFGRVAQYLSAHLGLSLPKVWSGGLRDRGTIGVVSFGELGLYVSGDCLELQPLERLVAKLSYGLYLAQAERWLAAYGLVHEEPEQRLSRLSALGEAHMGLMGKEGLSPEAQRLLGALRKLPDELQRSLKGCSPVGELSRWLRGVEQSAYRVALLTSGDLRGVIELMRTEPSLSGDSFEARLYRLLLFAVSPPYVELRSNLGLGYQTQLY